VNRQFFKPINIIALYRPKKIHVRKYRAIADIVSSHCDRDTYLVGDLNLDFSLPPSQECRQFRFMIFQHGFEQLITAPTHHYVAGGSFQQSVIDLIISNCSRSNIKSGVLPCSLSPDHDLVFAICGKTTTQGPARALSYRPIKSLDQPLFRKIVDKLSFAH
jgi:hypothetical protein